MAMKWLAQTAEGKCGQKLMAKTTGHGKAHGKTTVVGQNRLKHHHL
jgi:hypothetical protein